MAGRKESPRRLPRGPGVSRIARAPATSAFDVEAVDRAVRHRRGVIAPPARQIEDRTTVDQTHDPYRQSFISHPADSHFPIQNLPFGVCRRPDDAAPRVCTAIGDHVVDLAVLDEAGLFDGPELAGRRVFAAGALNPFMALGRAAWREARARLSHLLDVETLTLQDDKPLRAKAILPMRDVELRLPVEIGDYTDFYSSREHATNVGTMFRGADNALMPNWLHLPVGYHGRASSVVVSGTPVRRPLGQTHDGQAAAPDFGPTRELDFELEVGALVGTGNPLGTPIPAAHALDHVFGLVLVNDWSARDIQRWEYVPLGPFLAKSFGTTISPWVVTLDALEPFRCPGPTQRPTPLPYLEVPGDQAYDIALEVALQSEAMRRTERLKTPTACARPTSNTSTGASPSRWRTTPSAGATCAPATCSRQAPSAARRPTAAAACSRSRGAAACRCACPTATSGGSSRTAIV